MMTRFKLRRIHELLALPPAAPIAPPAGGPRPSVATLLGRREFLKVLGLAVAALGLPVARIERAYALARGRFFTPHEFATLAALCGRIIPADADPGATELGAPDYISRVLTAFDRRHPSIFARGPFSGRSPFPDNIQGIPSRHRPSNRFRRPLPLSPAQELYWRAQIFGSQAAGVPAHIDTQNGGPLKGLRDVYRDGLQAVDDAAVTSTGRLFVELMASEQDAVITALDAPGAMPPIPGRDHTFLDILIQHTIEGCFAAPEYGGNRQANGWAMLGLEGDSQPLGYSIYSLATDGYNERPDHPVSTPNPDELAPDGSLSPRPLTADGQFIQDSIVTLTSILPEGCG